MTANLYSKWPPGLREFANAYELSDETAQTLADTWDTIRGRKPQTREEWARLWEFVKQLLNEDSDLMREAMKGQEE